MNAVDTNVLIYARDPRDERKQRLARQLISELTDGVMLWQVSCEYLAACRKLRHAHWSLEDAANDIADLRKVWFTASPDWDTLERAARLSKDHSISFWDAMIVSSCEASGVDRLFSEDIPNHSAYGSIAVINPFLESQR